MKIKLDVKHKKYDITLRKILRELKRMDILTIDHKTDGIIHNIQAELK